MEKNSTNKGKHVSYNSKSNKKNTSLKISFLVILMLIVCGMLVYKFTRTPNSKFSKYEHSSRTNQQRIYG